MSTSITRLRCIQAQYTPAVCKINMSVCFTQINNTIYSAPVDNFVDRQGIWCYAAGNGTGENPRKQKDICEMTELPEKQIKRLRSLIQDAEVNLAAAKELLISLVGEEPVMRKGDSEEVAGKVIEGVFDGQGMIGPDGKSYPVPANYASKSKLVEGDILKLTIADDGGFIYKQIGPVARKQLIGTLVQHDGTYFVEAGGREYRVLLASVTYFKAKAGDQVSIIVPEDNREAEWAAIEAGL